MRILLALAAAFAVSGCGQTGPLSLPDDEVETPVEIRKKDEDTKPVTPPGR
jgi:predicted small lipoprotein YifL